MSNNRHDIGRNPGPIDRSITKLLYISNAKYGGDWNSLLHTHSFTELFYVVGDRGQFKIGEHLIPVAADDLVLVNPNVPHTELSLNAAPLEYIVLGVAGLEFLPREDSSEYSLTNFCGSTEEVQFYMRSMLREIEQKRTGYEMVCQDLLELLLINLVRQSQATLSAAAPAAQRSNRECATVRRYIENHFKEALTLDMLSELAHLNKYYMVHIFTREYGVSPINYLIACRIQESLHLLEKTDHPLSRISHMLGFSSPSYFSQSFRRLQGISPMEFRKRCRDSEGQPAPEPVPDRVVCEAVPSS
ncbi:MAG: helix-turn-helix transcriptional regulator [Clostridiales bacterium]|nr:helix-turn-helix transcriptional regulator [Clostridiales bacterium]